MNSGSRSANSTVHSMYIGTYRGRSTGSKLDSGHYAELSRWEGHYTTWDSLH